MKASTATAIRLADAQTEVEQEKRRLDAFLAGDLRGGAFQSRARLVSDYAAALASYRKRLAQHHAALVAEYDEPMEAEEAIGGAA